MRTGLLIVSHGSKDTTWVTLVDEAIAGAQWPEGLPVASSFLEGVPERSIQDGIDELEAQGVEQIGVVPLFVSSGSTHVDEIAYALGAKSEPLCETDLEPFRVNAHIEYGKPIDDDEAMLAMLRDRLTSIGVEPARDGVVLVAHGSPHMPFQDWWRDGLNRIANKLVQEKRCASAAHTLLCCDPLPAAVQQMLGQLQASGSGACGERPGRVAVVPVFLSKGYFTMKAIPDRLALELPAAEESAETQSLYIDWREHVLYDGEPLLPHPALSTWLEQESSRVLQRLANGRV